MLPSAPSSAQRLEPETSPGSQSRLARVPASSFSMVLGISGLGNTWRVAHRVWGAPAIAGEALMGLGTLLWVVLLMLYVAKWIASPRTARLELFDAVDASFIGLIGVGGLLSAAFMISYSDLAAWVLFGLGAAWTMAYAVWQTGAIWKADRALAPTTAALYLPTVAGSFVTGTVAAALGLVAWGQMAFGVGMFSWLAIESVLMQRLYAAGPLPVIQRPSLGIQFAPPVVAGVTYMSITSGRPDLFVNALVGYGLFQALVIARLIRWIGQQALGPSYWAFTFGSASLATTVLRMFERGEASLAMTVAPAVFILANVVVVVATAGTMRHIWLQDRWRAPGGQR